VVVKWAKHWADILGETDGGKTHGDFPQSQIQLRVLQRRQRNVIQFQAGAVALHTLTSDPILLL
jgi:hypothetical protein